MSQATESEPEHTVRTTDVNEVGLRLMLPVETYRMTNAHAYLCTRCGVPVIDIFTHEKWHATLQQAMGLIAGALETISGAPTHEPPAIMCANGERHWNGLVMERLTFTFADQDLPDRVRTLLTVADHQGCGPHTAWKERTTLVRWDEPEPPVHDLHSGGPT